MTREFITLKTVSYNFCFVETHLLGKKAYNKTYTIHDNFYTKQACIDSNKSKIFISSFYSVFPCKSDWLHNKMKF